MTRAEWLLVAIVCAGIGNGIYLSMICELLKGLIEVLKGDKHGV